MSSSGGSRFPVGGGGRRPIRGTPTSDAGPFWRKRTRKRKNCFLMGVCWQWPWIRQCSLWYKVLMIKPLADLGGGGMPGTCHPLWDPILLFSHTFSLKSASIGGPHTPNGSTPPYRKSWIRH